MPERFNLTQSRLFQISFRVVREYHRQMVSLHELDAKIGCGQVRLPQGYWFREIVEMAAHDVMIVECTEAEWFARNFAPSAYDRIIEHSIQQIGTRVRAALRGLRGDHEQQVARDWVAFHKAAKAANAAGR